MDRAYIDERMTLAELTTHYAQVRRRLYGKPAPVKSAPPVVGISRDVAIRIVCMKYGCTIDDLVGYRRQFTQARRELWSRCRHKVVIGNNRRPKFREIGIWFERDSETIRMGVERHDAWVAK